MKTFNYVIKDAEGIHARPAGILVKAAMEFQSSINIEKGDKKGNLKRVFSVMGLGVKCGDEIVITFDGDDEEKAFEIISELITLNL